LQLKCFLLAARRGSAIADDLVRSGHKNTRFVSARQKIFKKEAAGIEPATTTDTHRNHPTRPDVAPGLNV
jgi:hypothetical protein